MTIYERIDAAFMELAKTEFKKDKWVGKSVVTRDANGKKIKTPDLTQDGYYVMEISQILSTVQRVHAAHGIKCVFEGPYYDASNGEKRITIDYQTSRGDSKRVIANGHYHVRIIGEGPDDMIEMDVQCEAWDTPGNDKLGNKLLTNAQRCLYRSLYAIDGDDSQDPEEVNTAITGQAPPRAAEDPFFGNTEASGVSNTEADVTKENPAQEDVNFKKAAECRKAINDWVSEDPLVNAGHEIIADFVQRFGMLDQWKAGTCIQCYKELKDAEVKGLKEVVE